MLFYADRSDDVIQNKRVQPREDSKRPKQIIVMGERPTVAVSAPTEAQDTDRATRNRDAAAWESPESMSR